MENFKINSKVEDYIKVPRFIFKDKQLTGNAKMLYGLFYDRACLSQFVHSHFVDKDGNVRIRYDYTEIMEDMGISIGTAYKLVRDLKKHGFIYEDKYRYIYIKIE